MTEADIIGKLSRIFETHAFSEEDAEFDLEDLLGDFDSPYFNSSPGRYGGGSGGFAMTSSSPQQRLGRHIPEERMTASAGGGG